MSKPIPHLLRVECLMSELQSGSPPTGLLSGVQSP